MSILKAEILSRVNSVLSRSETDIDDEIEITLSDISKRANFLVKEATRDTVVGTDYYSVPENFKDMTDIRISDDEDPLERISHNRYLKLSADDDSTDTPTKYALHHGYYWLHPCPDAIYTMTLYYSIFHPKNADSIQFDEEFREAINEGTMIKVAEKYEDWDSVAKHKALYEEQIQLLIPSVKRPIGFINYNDI